MIGIDEVSWTYPHAEAASLDHMNLHIEAGQFLVLCGASGSGKSTALRLINGLIPHFHEDGILSGTVTVAGLATSTVELDEIGLATGSVLQHPRRQFFTDSAGEEIAFAMENFGFEPEMIRDRVRTGLETLAAGVPVGNRLSELSGGQAQQVAIAAARAHDPRILILDEPSSNLSAGAVEELRVTLEGLKARGVTIIIAEHRLPYLEGLADRVVVMREGRIDVEWSAEEFQAVTDEELAAEGLRGKAAGTACLPVLPAVGPSVAVDAEQSATPRQTPQQVTGQGLDLTGVRCRLGSRVVIDLDHVQFPAGEVTAIRGANGVGKSTLARIITGLQRSSGTVRLDGKVLNRRARQRASAIVMQDVQRQLFTDSVAAEIDLAAVDTRVSVDLRDVLTSLGLDDLAERHPLSLSGGQQQRLVIAAVRVAGRRIVVFDEPSSGVDRRHLRSISEQIRSVAAAGAVVLLISHDEDLLALAANQVLRLRSPGSTVG